MKTPYFTPEQRHVIAETYRVLADILDSDASEDELVDKMMAVLTAGMDMIGERENFEQAKKHILGEDDG